MIIPLSPKHYAYAQNFLSRANNVLDIYIVFSGEQDFLNFPVKTGFSPIVMPHDFHFGDGIITEKKFYALHYLQGSHYDYFIVCDAEIDTIPENFVKTNILCKIENIFQNKLIYGGRNDSMKNFSITSADVFDETDYKRLSQITDDFRYYFWWSDLPVYKKDHLEHFFSIIRGFGFNNFDNLIYVYYLLLYHDFKIVDIGALIGCYFSLESYSDENDEKLEKLVAVQYGFSWVIPSFFHKKKDFLLRQGTFLLYHLDRGPVQADQVQNVRKQRTFVAGKKPPPQPNNNIHKARTRPIVIFSRKK